MGCVRIGCNSRLPDWMRTNRLPMRWYLLNLFLLLPALGFWFSVIMLWSCGERCHKCHGSRIAGGGHTRQRHGISDDQEPVCRRSYNNGGVDFGSGFLVGIKKI